VTGELRHALERVLNRARGVEERAAARELRHLLESLDLFTRGGPAAIIVSAQTAVVPKLALRAKTPHGPRTESATRNKYVRALHELGFSLEEIQALAFKDVQKVGAAFTVAHVRLEGANAKLLEDLLRWGWGPTIAADVQPDPAWPLLPRSPGVAEPPTLRQLQHAVTLGGLRNIPA